MDRFAEDVALLYLLNQDTKGLSLAELCKLYAETVEQAKAAKTEYQRSEFGPAFSFD